MPSTRSFAAGLQHADTPAAKRGVSWGYGAFISAIAARNITESGYITTSPSDCSEENMTLQIEEMEDELDGMIREADNSISELKEKIETGRVRKPEHERVRCRLHKEKREYLKFKKDVLEMYELLELGEKVEQFEELEENRKNNFRFK